MMLMLIADTTSHNGMKVFGLISLMLMLLLALILMPMIVACNVSIDKNVQAEFLRGKRKISEDEEAEDLTGIRASLDEPPSSSNNSNSNSNQTPGKRRPSESSVSNGSPAQRTNTLSQAAPERSPTNSYSRMRSPTAAGFSLSPNNNSTAGPTSPDFGSNYRLSPNYGQTPSMLSPPSMLSSAMVEV